MAAIAAEAGVTRQTVYAHFGSRDDLVDAVITRTTEQAVAAMREADLDSGPARDALLRMLAVGWRFFRVTPLAQHVGAFARQRDEDRQLPVNDRLLRLVRRGQRAGEFDDTLSAPWLVTAIVAVSHAAGDEVRSGRMAQPDAEKVLRASVLRLVGGENIP